MTLLLVEALPSLLLIRDHRITFNVVDDLRLHFRANGRTNGQLTIDISQENFQFYLVASISGELGDIQRLVFLYSELLTGYFNYSYHNLKLGMQKYGEKIDYQAELEDFK